MMTYINITKKSDLQTFLNSLNIEPSHSDYHNCYGLSCTKKITERTSITMLENFIKQLIEHITTQLRQQSIPKGNATFYMWFDEQVGHLCFNVIYRQIDQLPFCCNITYVNSTLPILNLMKQSSIIGGIISLQEVVFDNFEDDEDDMSHYTLLVYKLYL